jgi:hypothetical protein
MWISSRTTSEMPAEPAPAGDSAAGAWSACEGEASVDRSAAGGWGCVASAGCSSAGCSSSSQQLATGRVAGVESGGVCYRCASSTEICLLPYCLHVHLCLGMTRCMPDQCHVALHELQLYFSGTVAPAAPASRSCLALFPHCSPFSSFGGSSSTECATTPAVLRAFH